jgi:hypothetical protein
MAVVIGGPNFDHFARDVADAHAILTDLSDRGMLLAWTPRSTTRKTP